jgi:hypothetical protein
MITPTFGLTATERVLPALALDFTTALLDNRVTFTRAGNTATVVNSSGYITGINADLPRFDFDPITLVCRGLLIEETRTNSLLQSEDFSATWSASAGLVLTTDTTTAPDNNTAADTIASDGTNTLANISQTVTASGTVAISLFVKQNVGGSVFLRLNGVGVGGQANAIYRFNFSTTSLVRVSGGTAASTSVVAYANGWYRISLVFSTTSVSGVVLYPAYNSSSTNSFFAWGAQLEAGAFATSYIPTTTTALTRNADVATMAGTNFSDWYDAGAGGVVACVLPSTVSGTRPALQFDDVTANEVITLRGATTNPELVIVDGGSPQAQIDAGTIAANTVYNLGAAWNTDDCAAAVNGGAAVTDNSAIIPTVTQARLGSDGSNYLNGHLQTLRYWPQRIINAEVQAFSK